MDGWGTPAGIQWLPGAPSEGYSDQGVKLTTHNFTFTFNYECTCCGVTAGDDTAS